jgi:subtilisin family serine protease
MTPVSNTVPNKVSKPVHPFIVCMGIAILLTLVQGSFIPALAQGPENYIVTFRDGTIPAVRAVAANNAGAALRFNYSIINAIAVTVPNANALAAFENNPSVLSIVPDRPVFAFQQANGKGGEKGKPPKDEDPPEDPPADPPPTMQEVPSGVKRVGADPALGGLTGAGVGVAIVDTGIDLGHADLTGVNEGFSSFGVGESCQDDNGHGTHVTGIVAARHNTIDVVGVAPGATLYCVKVLDADGVGSDSTVIAGLDWILANKDTLVPPIRVVNMSLGGPGSLGDPNDPDPMRVAIQALYDQGQGIAVVVAAGNDPTVEVTAQVPAAYPDGCGEYNCHRGNQCVSPPELDR